MDENIDFESTTRGRKAKYRAGHDKFCQKLLAERIGDGTYSLKNFGRIVNVISRPGYINIEKFMGTEDELEYVIESLYANDGRDFNPLTNYPPGMLRDYGNDYELHAQGIYYRQHYSEDFIVCDRKIWTPSLSKDEQDPYKIFDLRVRAHILAKHAQSNEKWRKSEYSWEADAWSDVFRHIRDDPCLKTDKHDYLALVPDTDPVLRKLTGKSTFVKRTPDATFGLSTFTNQDGELPAWAYDLHSERLDRLLYHAKFGLYSDPKRFETDLVFPFMEYEAKGWSGDCRVARRQACLINWHESLGHWTTIDPIRLRVFQRLWSGHVIHAKIAQELLALIDQIHLWATTEHRGFVLNHLKPWHSLCQENYLLEWDSAHDLGSHTKKKRICSDTEDLAVSSWVHYLSEPSRRNFQCRAKSSLAAAIKQHELLNGIFESEYEAYPAWTCVLDRCMTDVSSDTAFIERLRHTHGWEESRLARMRWCIKQEKMLQTVRNRQKRGIGATGLTLPWVLHRRRFQGQRQEQEEDVDVEADDLVLCNGMKRVKLS